MDDTLHTWARMPEYFQSHPLESPSSPTRNPYSWTFGMEGQDWIKVMGRTPENMRKFAIGISVSHFIPHTPLSLSHPDCGRAPPLRP